jgi:hypothetical protein
MVHKGMYFIGDFQRQRLIKDWQPSLAFVVANQELSK